MTNWTPLSCGRGLNLDWAEETLADYAQVPDGAFSIRCE